MTKISLKLSYFWQNVCGQFNNSLTDSFDNLPIEVVRNFTAERRTVAFCCRQHVSVLHAPSGILVHSTTVRNVLVTFETTLSFPCRSRCPVVVGGGGSDHRHASYTDHQQKDSCFRRRPSSPTVSRHADDIRPSATNNRKKPPKFCRLLHTENNVQLSRFQTQFTRNWKRSKSVKQNYSKPADGYAYLLIISASKLRLNGAVITVSDSWLLSIDALHAARLHARRVRCEFY